ncbi:aldo/keto reductase [Microbulbifer sp. OS29]|uniref:Aldo/keto reductase n=1 Tax=Microbulbifer okhotskensis TaxID=2926617 RepID=A0A9X2EQT0_9GAMM|nr:aldo/keto reductase [Microbulbifer okhotskensis]MCO1336754.1 aldo/keto reductase [Microbulbifer okhotskensis]
MQKVSKIKAISDKYGISNKVIGLQFVLANPAVAAVIPGASKPSRIKEDVEALETNIPEAVWQELRQEHLVDDSAPLPTGK